MGERLAMFDFHVGQDAGGAESLRTPLGPSKPGTFCITRFRPAKITYSTLSPSLQLASMQERGMQLHEPIIQGIPFEIQGVPSMVDMFDSPCSMLGCPRELWSSTELLMGCQSNSKFMQLQIDFDVH